MNVNEVSKHVRKQEWIERIQQCRSRGLSVRKWCERNANPTPTYYYWLKRIRNEIFDTITQNESVSFMPLIVETNESTSTEAKDTSTVAVLVKNDVRIELSNSISKEMLITILDSL